ncbi:MAG: FAD-dependent oxidoreductase, partial [Pseudomonadota bacterium]
ALAARAQSAGAALRTACPVAGLLPERGRWRVDLAEGAPLMARAVLGALAPPLLARLLPPERAAPLGTARWSSAVSVMLGVPDDLPLRAYWTNVVHPTRLFGTAFRLDRLNPELAAPGEALLNLAAYGPDEPGALVREPTEAIVARFEEAWTEAFHHHLRPRWSHVTRLPRYSPVFAPGYENPSAHQPGSPDLWLAGAALTWPQVTSSGPALGSGWATAGALLAARGLRDREEPG